MSDGDREKQKGYYHIPGLGVYISNPVFPFFLFSARPFLDVDTSNSCRHPSVENKLKLFHFLFYINNMKILAYHELFLMSFVYKIRRKNHARVISETKREFDILSRLGEMGVEDWLRVVVLTSVLSNSKRKKRERNFYPRREVSSIKCCQRQWEEAGLL